MAERLTHHQTNRRVRVHPPRPSDARTRAPAPPRTIIRKIRYRPDEWAIVLRHAGVCQIPPAEYVRDVSLGYTPRVRRRHPDLELVRQLLRIGNNLNQLTAVAHRAGQVSVGEQCAVVLAEVTAAAERVGRRMAADDHAGGDPGEGAEPSPNPKDNPVTVRANDRSLE